MNIEMSFQRVCRISTATLHLRLYDELKLKKTAAIHLLHPEVFLLAESDRNQGPPLSLGRQTFHAR
jgi:hypothetical protein